jgi:hypothetical protein
MRIPEASFILAAIHRIESWIGDSSEIGPAARYGRLSSSSSFCTPPCDFSLNAMHLLIIFSVLEVLAILVVVSLCVMAKRADDRTERALTSEEIRARRETADERRRPSHVPVFSDNPIGRWWNSVLRPINRDKRGS